MSSTTDTAGHPDVAEISDLTEGLLPPSRTADVRRHLDECELCADVQASLEEIRELLGTLPGPTRMPDDVAGRIDAALAAEALLSATAADDVYQADAGRATPVGTARPISVADDSVRVSRETSTAASRPAGHARSSTTGPGRKDRKKAGRRKVAILSAAFTAAALGLGSVLLTSLMGGSGAGPTADGEHTTADTFSAAKLEKQVSDLLAKNESSPGGSRKPDHSMGIEGGPDTKSTQPLRDTVPECIRKGIGRTDAALAAEEGIYKGRDTLLVVLPDASDVSRITVYLMDATCVKNASSTPAEVLLKDSYPRS
ncbi:anti-sigma factor family protein [Streptomyces sp. CA-251387]|uniref:anti-sigma factor family protein n=1 Tax=Streptomyces sp. CA-251387 TaxID=3240064 RepID=UPI003D933528